QGPLQGFLARQAKQFGVWLVGGTIPLAAEAADKVRAACLVFDERGERVAVLAVDPSSPFSGGALLGDRLRMPRLLARGGFVRSLATRGSLGGLAAACADCLELLRAAPFSWVLVETIGVGQDEVDVASVVDTVVPVSRSRAWGTRCSWLRRG
ncbi:MAG: hypothetical protein N2447_07150, partial [Thermoanaerobaculum sp.]|nr:hypothetical protein [Thermoanaerobaculum sp.]